MEQTVNWEKVYVDTLVRHTKDGGSIPLSIKFSDGKTYICELQDVRYILYEPFKSAEDAAAFIRTILKEHHVHIKTAAADDIALCREKYNLMKRRKLR